MTDTPPIRPRERDAILQSLRSGVVPRTGFQHIQVGRFNEVNAVVQDLDRILDGGAAIRFIIGEFGSGKTFFLYLTRALALSRKMVTIHADLNPDRRLYGSGGQARSLYTELMRNLSTRSKPDGEALTSVVEVFIGEAVKEARVRGVSPADAIQERLSILSEMVGGYDFADVLNAYWRGYEQGDEGLKASAVRWLRGEFSTRTDARSVLGVRQIVDDGNVYDYLKLMARFVRLAGYGGLLICLDEMVNLYKLANTQARSSNYEQILRILNDCLQGNVAGCGFLLGGTPEFLLDTRKGLYSYPALASRLAENPFATGGLVDYTGPVIGLANLSPEEMYLLLTKLRRVYNTGKSETDLIPDEGIQAFMAHCSQRIGDAYFRTPRNTITAFINLLAVLDQNPSASWQEMVGQVGVASESNTDLVPFTNGEDSGTEPPASTDDSNDLTSFRL